jgi:hypothetical protein
MKGWERRGGTDHALTSPPLQLAFGEKMGIVGNLPELGAWDPQRAPLLQWTEGDVWVRSLRLLNFRCRHSVSSAE